MPHPSNFHEFARNKGYESGRERVLDDEVSDHLTPWLLNWCLNQATGGKSKSASASKLGQPAVRFCLRRRISATNLKDLRNALILRPFLMLVYINDEAERLIKNRRNLKRNYEKGVIEEFRFQSSDKLIRNTLRVVDTYLDDGGSAWQIDWEAGGLRRRVDQEMQVIYDNAVQVEDAISEYVREAWRKAWGFQPDGDGAYRDAVDALEATFGSVVLPNSDDQTLGKIVSALTDKTSKWEVGLLDHSVKATRGTPIDGVQQLAALLDWIWRGSQRHGKPDEYVENTLTEARDAVILAVALIQLQRRDFLREAGKQRQGES